GSVDAPAARGRRRPPWAARDRVVGVVESAVLVLLTATTPDHEHDGAHAEQHEQHTEEDHQLGEEGEAAVLLLFRGRGRRGLGRGRARLRARALTRLRARARRGLQVDHHQLDAGDRLAGGDLPVVLVVLTVVAALLRHQGDPAGSDRPVRLGPDVEPALAVGAAAVLVAGTVDED